MKNIRISCQVDGYSSPLPRQEISVRGKSAASALRTWMRLSGFNMRYAPGLDETGTTVRAFIGLRSYGRPAWAEATEIVSRPAATQSHRGEMEGQSTVKITPSGKFAEVQWRDRP